MATGRREFPLLGARGTTGLFIVDGKNQFQTPENKLNDPTQKCRCFTFSKDGNLFAWCNMQCLQVFNVNSNQVILEVPKQKTSFLSISPLNNFICSWEGYYTTPDNPNGFNNLEIHQISDGAVVKGFIQKKQETWEPQWTDDESLCARSVSNEIHFYENGQFTSVANKLHQQNVTSFSIAPGNTPHKIAIFVKGTKAAPSFVRLFQYPNLQSQSALANRSFFKADKVEMFWNKKGTSLLILTSTEVDTTGSSYYGEQALHFMSARGEASLIPFDKNGPVYSVDWSPNSNEFCVVYGYMPAKAKIFNIKCEPVFDFGTGPRNECHYNPHGTILCLAGFGNLRGVMEFWNVKEKKQISKPQASDSTQFQWAPDGVHFLTATTSPRLKIGNGYKIWHYTGKELHHTALSTGHELYQIEWQPALDGMYKEAAILVASRPLTTQAKAQAYRPPSARASGTQSIKLHEEEPAQNARGQQLSGAALKNKKKRETKAKSADQTQQISEPNISTVMTENEKKIKNLKKKLRQVQDLKVKQKEGKQLEKNQLEKISSERDLLLEIRELELSS